MRAHVRPFFNFLRKLRAAKAIVPFWWSNHESARLISAAESTCLSSAFLCLPVFPTDASVEQASMANRFQFALRLAYRFAHPESMEILF